MLSTGLGTTAVAINFTINVDVGYCCLTPGIGGQGGQRVDI